MPNPKTIKEIKDSFGKLQLNTGLEPGLALENFVIISDFLESSLFSLLDEVEKNVMAKGASHNDYCECLEDANMPCDCGVAEYNTAIREVLKLLSDIREVK